MERKQFTFYRSYWEAIQALPKQAQLPLYRAICEYALLGKEPELTGVASGAFILIRPTLDRARRQSEGARKTNDLLGSQDRTSTSARYPDAYRSLAGRFEH